MTGPRGKKRPFNDFIKSKKAYNRCIVNRNIQLLKNGYIAWAALV